jgi:hypothetical protein
MRAEDLMAAVFPDQAACPENLTGEVRIPNHPLVRQTIDDCLHEAMDLDGLARILNDIHAGKISTVAIETAEPSPLAHEILNSNPYAYLDDAPLEERRARAVQLRRSLPVDEATSFGALDPQAIRQVSEESWPLVRNADELHDALLTLTVLPPVPEWNEHFESLVAARRAGQLVRPSVASRVPLANARGSEALILSRDREGAVVKHSYCALPAVATNPRRRPVWRAIINSSFVGITQTETLLVAAEMRCSLRVLASLSRIIPSHLEDSQMRRRISAEFSPIPAVNTNPSTPPSAAASAPICLAA